MDDNLIEGYVYTVCVEHIFERGVEISLHCEYVALVALRRELQRNARSAERADAVVRNVFYRSLYFEFGKFGLYNFLNFAEVCTVVDIDKRYRNGGLYRLV